MDKQIRDLRCINLYGKHIVDLEKSRDNYKSLINSLYAERDDLDKKIKLFDMSIQEQKNQYVKNSKGMLGFLSFSGIGLYNGIIFNVLHHSFLIYIILLIPNIVFLYISMTNYNKIDGESAPILMFSDSEKQEILKRREQIGGAFDGELGLAYANYEDICRKLKKLEMV